MSNRVINETRTKLLIALAEAGRAALEFDPLSASALAAIANTDKYVAAGTLRGILSMAGKVMDESAPAVPAPSQVPAELSDERIVDLMLAADERAFSVPVGVLVRGARAIERELRAGSSDVRDQEPWISVEQCLPKKECLAVYVTPNGKQRIIRAKYASRFQIEAEGDDCETEYNDEDDTFYIKAGWLECIDNWGEYSSCYVTEGTVTHWMSLPAAPAASKEGGEHV
jgi:hypothetical protein